MNLLVAWVREEAEVLNVLESPSNKLEAIPEFGFFPVVGVGAVVF